MHDIDTVRMEYEGDREGFSYEGEFEGEAPLTETEEEMLAAELLGVTSEAEMNQFLGKLFKQVSKSAGGIGKFLKRNAGPLAGALKGIAKKALPTVGAALGTAIPIPGVGTSVGGMLGNAAANMLEAELEGLNEEDREFEMAKRFVRLAGHATKSGARKPPTMNRRAAVFGAVRDGMRRMRAQRIARARARARSGHNGRGASQPGFQDSAGPEGGSDISGGFDVAQSGGGDAALDDLDTDGVGDVDLSADTDPAADAVSGEFEGAIGAPTGGARSGRWVRRGGKIVLLGV